MTDTKTAPFTRLHQNALKQRTHALLQRDDLFEHIPEMDALDVYYTITSLGLSDASPILAALSPDQIQRCIDLSAWEKENIYFDEIDAWLASFMAIGPDAPLDAFLSLDLELQQLWLMQRIRVYEVDEDTQAPPLAKGDERKNSDDRFFVIDCSSDDERDFHPFSLIDACYRRSPNLGYKLLKSLSAELPSQLTEAALRWRTGRMLDMGFPDTVQAMCIFAQPEQGTPAPLLSPVHETLPMHTLSFLEDAHDVIRMLTTIQNEDAVQALLEQLGWLVNHVVIATGLHPGNRHQRERLFEDVLNTLRLGIETLLDNKQPVPLPWEQTTLARGAHLLQRYGLFEIHRHAHQALLATVKPVLAGFDKAHLEVLYKLGDTQKESLRPDDLNDVFMVLAAHQSPQPKYAGFDALDPAKSMNLKSLSDLYRLESRLSETAQRWQQQFPLADLTADSLG